MKQADSSRLLHCCFTDIDELGAALNTQRNIQVTQLSNQKFRADLLLIAFDEAIFSFAKASCPVYSVGEKAPDYVCFTCIPEIDTHQPGPIAHNQTLCHNTIFGFDSYREIMMITPANLRVCNMQIHRDVLQSYLEVMERPDINQKFLASNFLSLPATMLPVKSYLINLFQGIQQYPKFFQLPHLKKIILEDIIPLLIDAIPPYSIASTKSAHSITRATLVKQVENYMMANLDQPITLKDLCQELNTNQRSIFYGFQEVFGMSPMAYLKTQRLHGVRRKLKVADPEIDSVTAIANQFGFWSVGHFARDYRKMFGERPSETMQQSKMWSESAHN
ncbi:MAG: helix-turn-helix domain-containing protein [Microcoleaceae cyanobacterium]